MVRANVCARARPRHAAALGLAFVLSILARAEWQAAAAAPPQVLDSRIARVTVYRNVAQVTRVATVALEPGVHIVAIDKLPLRTQVDALDCRLEGDARVLGLKIEVHSLLPDSVSPDRAGALQAKIAEIDRGTADLDAQLRVLEQKKEFLTGVRTEAPKALVRPPTAQAVATVEVGLRRTLDFVADEWLAMENAILALGRRKAALAQRREAAQADLKRITAPVQVENRHQANIEIEVKSQGQVQIALSYMVSGAAWRTYHDARLDQARSALEWSSFAEIRQTTGEDWSQVDLTVSTADLDAGKAIPEIEPIVLSSPPHLRETGVIQGRVCDSRTGRPIPYANVTLLGTDVGTLTGEDGSYTLRDAPPGVHAMQVSYVGYGTANRKDVAVVAGSQVQSDFALQDNEVGSKEILVEARAALVSKERADTHHVISSETLSASAGGGVVDAVSPAIALSAGVAQGSDERRRDRHGGNLQDRTARVHSLGWQLAPRDDRGPRFPGGARDRHRAASRPVRLPPCPGLESGSVTTASGAGPSLLGSRLPGEGRALGASLARRLAAHELRPARAHRGRADARRPIARPEPRR